MDGQGSGAEFRLGKFATAGKVRPKRRGKACSGAAGTVSRGTMRSDKARSVKVGLGRSGWFGRGLKRLGLTTRLFVSILLIVEDDGVFRSQVYNPVVFGS